MAAGSTHWTAIRSAIESATGLRGRLVPAGNVSGGDIHRATRARLGGAEFFIKLNSAEFAGMFEAEALGLEELGSSATLTVPSPVCHGRAGNTAYLVLEHLSLSRGGDARALGAGLAALHRVEHAQYGWHRDNAIGSTPQINDRTGNWMEFWRDRRLGYQLRLASSNGYVGRLQARGERLMGALAGLLGDHQPPASLLHGDLWAGNHAFGSTGEPVIFDPAVYFGDRETDLAMTGLFGGYSTDFYAAYCDCYPLDAGFRIRRTLYNLYHVLNHLNLFGGSYEAQAERMIDSLLAELG